MQALAGLVSHLAKRQLTLDRLAALFGTRLDRGICGTAHAPGSHDLRMLMSAFDFGHIVTAASLSCHSTVAAAQRAARWWLAANARRRAPATARIDESASVWSL
jgi:hypothetical protein